MRIPGTINRNVLRTYNYVKINRDLPNLLQSDDLSAWDWEIPKSLQEICLEAIAGNWEERPILNEIPLSIDRCLLLNILSTQLPLNLTVPNINHDIYWKRCYIHRWPKLLPRDVEKDVQINEIVTSNTSSRKSSGSNSTKSQILDKKKAWKEFFLEMHLNEYLEKLKPEDYDAQKIKELSDLCGSFVKVLNIRELQCSENSPNRIPLNSILTGLQNLSELSICFKQGAIVGASRDKIDKYLLISIKDMRTLLSRIELRHSTYVGDNFRWDTVKLPLHDVKLLAKGLERCKLTIFRIQNSNIDGEKATILLKSLIKHEDLQTIDFSHCQISDRGAVAISKFCMINSVSSLILSNNRIGAKGVEALCFTFCKNTCNVKTIDLKLNPLNKTGGKLLIKALTLGARSLERVFLNGCGLKNITTIGTMIENNSVLECLDLSNNALGEDVGKSILQGLKYNTNLKALDLRMCKLNSEEDFKILQKIIQNKKNGRKPVIIEPHFDFEISQELSEEIEGVFETIEDTSPQIVE